LYLFLISYLRLIFLSHYKGKESKEGEQEIGRSKTILDKGVIDDGIETLLGAFLQRSGHLDIFPMDIRRIPEIIPVSIGENESQVLDYLLGMADVIDKDEHHIMMSILSSYLQVIIIHLEKLLESIHIARFFNVQIHGGKHVGMMSILTLF